MKVLVTGGTGMLGKHLKELLPDAFYVGSKDYNLTKKLDVRNMFAKYQPDVVIHLAAKVGGIQDNIANPLQFLEENLLINTNVVLEAQKYNVKKFIGIGSTCAYPDRLNMSMYPMTEDLLHCGPPTPTNFGYGYAKRMLAVHLKTIRESKGLDYFTIFPSNLYSEYDNFNNYKKAHFVTALLKKIKDNEGSISLLGTGIPLRQFIHAEDLARIIIKCLDKDIMTDFNVCNDIRSIRSIAETALYATLNEHIELKFDNDTSKDGQYRKCCSSAKMMKLFPKFKFMSLANGLERVYNSI